MKRNYLFAGLLIVTLGVNAQVYRDKNSDVKMRVSDLLSRMTIEEKVGQLRSSFAANPKINAAFFEDKFKLDSLFANGISMINPDFNNSLEESITNRNKTQAYLRCENSFHSIMNVKTSDTEMRARQAYKIFEQENSV